MAYMDSLPSEQVLKFVIVGESAAGKTSLATRFTHNHFQKQHQQTLGIDFSMKRITLNGDLRVTIQVWDTGGKAVRSPMVDNYIFGAQAILLLYDISNLETFDNLEEWMAAIYRVNQGTLYAPHLALVANKVDLEHVRAVKRECHHRFVHEFGTSSHWVSAKTGESVALCFHKIAGEILGIRISRVEQDTTQPIVKAEIVQEPTSHRNNNNNNAVESKVPQNTKSAVCAVQ